MKRPRLLFLIFTVFAASVFSAPVDFGPLNRVPEERAQAWRRYQKGLNGTPAERGASMREYEENLTRIVLELRNAYYVRPATPNANPEAQVSDQMIESIGKMASLLENIEYPKNVAAGSSLHYASDVHLHKVHLLEAVILRMAKAISRESWDWAAAGAPRTPFDYATWISAWYAAGEEIPAPDKLD